MDSKFARADETRDYRAGLHEAPHLYADWCDIKFFRAAGRSASRISSLVSHSRSAECGRNSHYRPLGCLRTAHGTQLTRHRQRLRVGKTTNRRPFGRSCGVPGRLRRLRGLPHQTASGRTQNPMETYPARLLPYNGGAPVMHLL